MSDEADLFGNQIPLETVYRLEDARHIGVSALRNADQEIQVQAMKMWFYERFEDPAESTPYISSEGGYQYIHGGPHEPHEVLNDEFSGIVPDEVIEELGDELTDISFEWATRSDLEFDDYAFESITQSTQHYFSFFEALSSTRRLAAIDVPFPQQQHFHRLLYISAIIAFETYLSDSFISRVCSDHTLLRKFVESDRNFSKGSVPICDVFRFTDTIKDKVRDHLLNIVWHRMADTQRMFLETLGVTFPETLETLSEAIRIRHDIVHRSGKTKDGREHQIEKENIEKVAHTVDDIVWWIERQVNPGAERLTNDNDSQDPF